MEIYRIIKEIYRPTALDGKGAAIYGGRWNFRDIPTVYCAQSRSLAMLETLVHTGRLQSMPSDLILLTIRIPDESTVTLDMNKCPKGWDQTPVIFASQRIFTDFYKQNTDLCLFVPSVIVPEEFNVLLNPNHKLMKKVKVIGERKIKWDERYA